MLNRNGTAYQAVPSGLYVCFLLVKIRVQLQLSKLGIAHGLEFLQGAVRQLPQLGFLRRKLAAHLRQSVDQPAAAAGVVDTKQVLFLKSEVSLINSPFLCSFWALSFCVLPWAGFSAAP